MPHTSDIVRTRVPHLCAILSKSLSLKSNHEKKIRQIQTRDILQDSDSYPQDKTRKQETQGKTEATRHLSVMWYPELESGTKQ